MKNDKILNLAIEASNKAYSPYSNFCVGAVLVTSDNKAYIGCNIENHGIQSICAERVAFAKAISEGKTKKEDFSYIMVVGHNKDNVNLVKTLPCGYCRQFMSEFVNPNFKVYYYDNEIKCLELKDLLPHSFEL